MSANNWECVIEITGSEGMAIGESTTLEGSEEATEIFEAASEVFGFLPKTLSPFLVRNSCEQPQRSVNAALAKDSTTRQGIPASKTPLTCPRLVLHFAASGVARRRHFDGIST